MRSFAGLRGPRIEEDSPKCDEGCLSNAAGGSDDVMKGLIYVGPHTLEMII